MKIEEFIRLLDELSQLNGIEYSVKEAEKLYKYMQLLLEYNNNINLTAITDVEDIILKHFIDSSTIKKYFISNSKLIDVGTGAGFPGIVLKIIESNLNITLLDALNKRIKFLDEVINKNKLVNIITLHERAEIIGKNDGYREKYDYSISRAVASLNVLVEYMLPLIKVGGLSICMKGANVENELNEAKNAIEILGGRIISVDNIKLINRRNEVFERNIVLIKKIKTTDMKYPRNSNQINRKPL